MTMDQALEKKLIEALEALASGETVDRILARYPEDGEQLRPMLETAVQLSQLNLQPSLAAQIRSRQAFLSQAEVMRQALGQRSQLAPLRQLLFPLLSLALVLLVFGGMLFISANSAIPGDRLYNVKRLGENVRLALTADLEARTMLADQYRRERIEEIGILLATGREAPVEFEGLIESIQEENWVIAGLVTVVNEDTIVDGIREAGRWAHVNGQTRAGQLQALVITISPGNNEPEPVPTPAPTVTATDQPTASPTASPQPTTTREPTATATIEPSPTATTTPTLTASPTATPTPAATATLPPTPTLPPAPTVTPVSDNNDNDNNNGNSNDNDNDNGNDNSNDNGNDNGNDSSNENDNGGGNQNDSDDSDNAIDNSTDNSSDNDDDGNKD